MSDVRRIWSIGHSNHTFERFLELLRTNKIEVVVDVRSHPASRFSPQFNRETLRQRPANAGVKYGFLGRELGGRPDGDEFYDDDGHMLYGRFARTALFHNGIDRLEHGIDGFRVAMLCSEEDPTHCHRRLLITRVLSERGIEVLHIRGNGTVQTESVLGGGEQGDIFGGFEERAWRSTRSASHRSRPMSSSAS